MDPIEEALNIRFDKVSKFSAMRSDIKFLERKFGFIFADFPIFFVKNVADKTVGDCQF